MVITGFFSELNGQTAEVNSQNLPAPIQNFQHSLRLLKPEVPRWTVDLPATPGKIESWSLTHTDELSLVVNDPYSTNTYRVQQTDDGLTQWWLWWDAEAPSYFIPASEKSN